MQKCVENYELYYANSLGNLATFKWHSKVTNFTLNIQTGFSVCYCVWGVIPSIFFFWDLTANIFQSVMFFSYV